MSKSSVALALSGFLVAASVPLALLSLNWALDGPFDPAYPFWGAVGSVTVAVYLLVRRLWLGQPGVIPWLFLILAAPVVAFLVWLGLETDFMRLLGG